MRTAFLLLTICCCWSAASGQWPETTIPLPYGSYPRALCFNPLNNKIYSANRGNATVTVIDGETNEIVTTVAVGASPYDLCYSSRDNLVYCASSTTSSVWVIDGQGDSVVATLTVGSGPRVLCYNPINNKVYSANWYGNSVSIIHSGSVTNLSVAAHPFDLCYNEHYNKVYCSSSDGIALTVIDGASDTIIAVIPENYWPSYLVYNTKDDKLYCSHGADRIEIVDGATDWVIDTVGSWSGAHDPCYNPRNDKVYYACRDDWTGGHVMVIDGKGDSGITSVPIGWSPGPSCYNPQSNKAFFANTIDESTVTVISGMTDSEIRTIRVCGWPTALVHAPPYNRIYVACEYANPGIAVIRDTLFPAIEEGSQPRVLAVGLSSTVVGRVLTVPPRPNTGARAVPILLLDISGRKVLDLKPGANDVRALTPGVYLVCEGGVSREQGGAGIRKVVLTR
jgi:YVTN family beta-propeller protein